MLRQSSVRALVVVALVGMLAPSSTAQPKKSPAGLPSEIPAKFVETHDGWDYTRREAEIPMRDGVKLHTVILVPKGAKGAPMLLTRTPYKADKQTSWNSSTHLRMALDGYDNAVETIIEGGYIRVVQDIRGKHGSQGDYVMNRPLRGSQNRSANDHATDTYDTIAWLVKNVRESNGNVGIIGISYDGFTPLMALVDPHPALKVSVPMNPMVDGWRGDDWFHNGAFRQLGLSYIHDQEASRKNDVSWSKSHFDDYEMFLEAGSAGDLARRRGLEQLGFWKKLVAHPSYDAFWRDQAVDRILATKPLKVPVMIVHSLWDQEDIYGSTAVYKALEPKDTGNDKVFLVLGPWRHGQAIKDGSMLGQIAFDSDTALTFRREILLPFLDRHLKTGAPKADIAPVMAFETGTNKWRRLSKWPSGCDTGCTVKPTPLYLAAGSKVGFTAPRTAGYDEYISDPAQPVPFITRPVASAHEDSKLWREWLVTDQRNAASRPDVLVFTSDVLTAPIKISGEPIANLIASTSGTDSDWVVKLIDVYPPEVNGRPTMGGYQLAIAMDIFRGRYRESLETPKAIAAGQPLLYKFALPNANHVFLPGHRIMVQVQSTWFPLYDRNPQTFVPNIFLAKPGDYRKATQRVYHSPGQASFVELPIVQ
ncbi:MAG TPA: CocE/NonD family hydrolase [Kofleriaceae bacterium]